MIIVKELENSIFSIDKVFLRCYSAIEFQNLFLLDEIGEFQIKFCGKSTVLRVSLKRYV